MADYDEPISDDEKVRIVKSFLTHAPPGEFAEVFNDVRILLSNDTLLKEKAASAFVKYNTDQFIPAVVEGVKDPVLITSHGEAENGKYVDPRSKKSFRYDHLRNAVSEICDHDELDGEKWRLAVDEAFRPYIEEHYPHGAYAVYSKLDNGSVVLTVCIEDHKYEPLNFWNGRWRSEWCVTIDENGGNAQIVGILKNQVHYYEDGNVQLVSQKECKDNTSASNERQLAKDLLKLVSKAESDYQEAISANYHTMSETTFKALRRQLPITRAKVDWNKILGYKIGKELSK
ncbi:F-actin-capping protein subunit alpha-1-like [Styela clava]